MLNNNCHECGRPLPSLFSSSPCSTCRREAEMKEIAERQLEAIELATKTAHEDSVLALEAAEDDRRAREDAAQQAVRDREEAAQQAAWDREDAEQRALERQEEFLQRREEMHKNRFRLEAEEMRRSAETQFAAKRYREAQQLARRAYRQDPANIGAYAIAGWAARELGEVESLRTELASQISLLRIKLTALEALRIAQEIHHASLGQGLWANFIDVVREDTLVALDVVDTLLVRGQTDEARQLLKATDAGCRDPHLKVWQIAPFVYQMERASAKNRDVQSNLIRAIETSAYANRMSAWRSVERRQSLGASTKIAVCRAALVAHDAAGGGFDGFFWAALPYSIDYDRRESREPRPEDIRAFAKAVRTGLSSSRGRRDLLASFRVQPWSKFAPATRNDLLRIILIEYRSARKAIVNEAQCGTSQKATPLTSPITYLLIVYGTFALSAAGHDFMDSLGVAFVAWLAAGMLFSFGEYLLNRVLWARSHVCAERENLLKTLSVSAKEIDAVLPDVAPFPRRSFLALMAVAILGVVEFLVVPHLPQPKRDYWWFNVIARIPGVTVWQEWTANIYREPTATLVVPGSSELGLAPMDIHPDGTTIAAGDGVGNLFAWRLDDESTPMMIRDATDRQAAAALSVHFRPGRSEVAMTTEGRIIHWFDLPAGKRPSARDVRNFGAVEFLSFSPDGKQLATTKNKMVTLWSLNPLHKLRQLGEPGEHDPEYAMEPAWSPDGRHLAVGYSVNRDAAQGQPLPVRIWNVERGTEERKLSVPNGAWWLNYSPDGQFLATSSIYSSDVTVWSTTGTDRIVLPGRTNGILSVAFSPDGRWLATCGGGTEVSIFSTRTWRVTKRVWPSNSARVIQVAFSPDSKQLVTSTLDRRVLIWEIF